MLNAYWDERQGATMQTLKEWWGKFKAGVLTHWVWVGAIASITLLIVSPLIGDADSRSVVKTIASVVLASGVAGAVIRSSTFTEMFIGRIVDVFYDGKHLRSRNDLSEICSRTLNALLEAESSVLRGAVSNELLSQYLDFKQGYVYKDFRVQVQVLRVDQVQGLIYVLETVRATVIPNTGRRSVTFLWSWDSPYTRMANAELMQISIDGKALPPESFAAKKDKHGVLRSAYVHAIEADKSSEVRPFELMRRVKKVIEAKSDPVTNYRFSVPALAMSVELMDFPEDKLHAQLASFGMPRQFEPDRKETDGVGQWRSMSYAGLIFPGQGAILQWFLK